jgi:hypothetical protein
MTTQQQILDFYATPGPMTSGGKYSALLKELPNDVRALVRVVQGLTVHEYVALDFYGFAIPGKRREESHIRLLEGMLDRLLAMDAQPLSVARPVEKRIVGVCHHFMLLLVATLRAKGIPARGRYGFGSYFNPGFFEDHSVCEYWNAAAARWVLVDPQFDEIWQRELKIEHDILDVPRDRLVTAGEIWTRCSKGEADPSKFGIFKGDLRGLWFIAGDIVRDLAALNKLEMLQWDVWGSMPRPNETLQHDQLAFFDRLAQLSRQPDASFDELRKIYAEDDRLHVPSTVFNAVLNRPEVILTAPPVDSEILPRSDKPKKRA